MDTVALVGRLMLSLAFVLCLMWLMARRMRKGNGRTKGARLIDVLARQQVARNSSVAVVRVMDKALIVGVTDGQVCVLGETDLAAVEAELGSTERPGTRLRRAAAALSNPAVTQRAAATGATGAIKTTEAIRGAGTPALAHSSAREAAERALAAVRARAAEPAPAPPGRPGAPTRRIRTLATPRQVGAAATAGAARRGPLAGSALSPQTWRQTLDALRDLTVRTR